ncbi:MAG: diguanylate cyclase [Actinobacteria bacterium]|nr:diguanylate cyclase [Actinomycetota bacterium]MBW3650630.1 diguanylate cyclase [Actinomycetota bacterium]
MALTIVVPITAVGVTVVNLIGNEAEERSFDRLQQATLSAEAILLDDKDEVNRLADAVAADSRLAAAISAGAEALEQTLPRIVREGDLDIAIVEDGTGEILARARTTPRFATGIAVPTDEELLGAQVEDRAVLAGAQLAEGGTLLVGRWLDAQSLDRVARAPGIALTLVDGRSVLASTQGLGRLPPRLGAGPFEARFGTGERLAYASEVPRLGLTVLATSVPPTGQDRANLILLFGGLLFVLTVLIVLVGYVVSGLVTGPVEDLVEAALAVSRGDLTQRVDVAGDVELATLGRAFNQMTDNLREYVEQLEQSRREFQTAIARLGDVLVSTHDLGGIIDVVLEACALTLGANKAVFYERVALPARVRASAVNEGDVPAVELNGTGVAGAAARQLMPIVHPGNAELAPEEPAVEAAVAVPVVVENRLEGVLALYGRVAGGTFRTDDINTLQTLGRQAEVAIGNVYLHDETRRQARTDGMTGLWNRREFELRCRDAVREASRFGESFGVILVDIDDFKQVNDRFDHSTGDAALIWLAERLSDATREIDVVARWGGEEFIVLLPRAGLEETAAVAERVRSYIAREPMRDGEKVLPLTVSIGFACHPHDGTSADELFRAADTALGRAKRMGKNRVEQARPTEGVEV